MGHPSVGGLGPASSQMVPEVSGEATLTRSGEVMAGAMVVRVCQDFKDVAWVHYDIDFRCQAALTKNKMWLRIDVTLILGVLLLCHPWPLFCPFKPCPHSSSTFALVLRLCTTNGYHNFKNSHSPSRVFRDTFPFTTQAICSLCIHKDF